MSVEMVMPRMGESITEGTILKWLKKEGDPVERDEIILEISTDKVDSEIPSPTSGVLKKILAQEGETVEVGMVIAEIAGEGEAVEAPAEPAVAENGKSAEPEPAPAAAEQPAPAAPVAAPEPVAVAAEQPAPAADGEKRFYSPVVRKIAAEEGVSEQELATIPGSGASGRVTKKDILAWLENRGKQQPAAPAMPAQPAAQPAPSGGSMPAMPAQPAAPAFSGETRVVEMDTMRKAIAEHMVRSVQTSPHVYSISEADMTHIVAYREAVKDEFFKREGFKLTYQPFFMYAVAKALREYPDINVSVEGTKIIYKGNINIGMAVALDAGLIVPVAKNADMLNLLGMARMVNDLATRARTRKLKPDEVQEGTFTITNLGAFGNLYGTPIINQPQAAILGVGAIKKRVMVIDNSIAIRDMVYLSLGYDHRIIDGALGGRFLQAVVRNLETMNPEQI